MVNKIFALFHPFILLPYSKMKRKMFLGIFREYINYHQSASNSFDKRSPVTIKGYYNKYLLISEFLQEQNMLRMRGTEFKVSLAKKYLDHLLKTYSHNYAARCVDICGAVLDYGVNNEMIEYNPLSSFVIQKNPPKKPTYFTPYQIVKWENYTSPSTLKQKAADLFVLVMHTGFDYGDIEEIGRQHVIFHRGERYIIKPRHKNGNEAVIPLSNVAEEILEKYDYKMRILSNPKFNMALKEVARELEIPMHLTVKSGRKIFMMNKLNNEGYSMEATSKMGGHKSVKTTEQTYAQVNISLVHNEVLAKKN